MSKKITWTNEKRKLRDLIPWEHNPRQINKKEAERLGDSHDEFGQVQAIAIGPNNEIYDGHQRQVVWQILPQYGRDYVVDVRVSSRALTEKERQKLVVYLHKGATGEFDFDILANTIDIPDLLEWGFSDWELGIDGDDDEEKPDSQHKITRFGRMYNAGEGHDVEPFKLAYRVEAAYKAKSALALDLFSGAGQLAAWYNRRFDKVVTVDKNFQDGDVDYSMSACDFIVEHIKEYLDFDFVDFDDEGAPAVEIAALMEAVQGKKEPFVLCLTDGNGMNLKFRGNFTPSKYLQEGEMRKATRDDYDKFEDYVTQFVRKCALNNGFSPTQWSSYRGREGNVVYQTWLIEPQKQASLS